MALKDTDQDCRNCEYGEDKHDGSCECDVARALRLLCYFPKMTTYHPAEDGWKCHDFQWKRK